MQRCGSVAGVGAARVRRAINEWLQSLFVLSRRVIICDWLRADSIPALRVFSFHLINAVDVWRARVTLLPHPDRTSLASLSSRHIPFRKQPITLPVYY